MHFDWNELSYILLFTNPSRTFSMPIHAWYPCKDVTRVRYGFAANRVVWSLWSRLQGAVATPRTCESSRCYRKDKYLGCVCTYFGWLLFITLYLYFFIRQIAVIESLKLFPYLPHIQSEPLETQIYIFFLTFMLLLVIDAVHGTQLSTIFWIQGFNIRVLNIRCDWEMLFSIEFGHFMIILCECGLIEMIDL